MAKNNHEETGTHRTRRLDDLFKDDPFLSPTMRARQLLDKSMELPIIDENGETVTQPVTQPQPVTPVASTEVDENEPTELVLIHSTKSTPGRIPFLLAAAYLRAKGDQLPHVPGVQGLRRFRRTVLEEWLRYVPDRD